MVTSMKAGFLTKKPYCYALLIAGISFLLWATIFINDHFSSRTLNSTYSAYIKEIIQHEQVSISQIYSIDVEMLQIIYENPLVSNYVSAMSEGNREEIAETQQALEAFFSTLVKHDEHIRQLRIIGIANQGRELIRLERKNGQVHIVPDRSLQVKGQRDYFTNSLELSPEANYVSAITLNRENGVLDYPYWPTYRLAKTLYNEQGETFGVLVMNIAAERILQMLSSTIDTDISYYLLNADGDFLYHPNNKMTFGFDLGKRVRWDDQFVPSDEALPNMGNLTTYSMPAANDELYAESLRIYYNGNPQKDYLELVVGVTRSKLDEMIRMERTGGVVVAAVSLTILGMAIAIFIAMMQMKNRLLAKQAEYKKIIEESLNGIITISPEGVVRQWNAAATNITGYSAVDARGRNIFDVLQFKNTTYFNTDVLNLISAGESIKEVDLVALDSSGKPVDVTLSIFRLTPDDKTTIDNGSIVIVLTDTSEQRRLEMQVKNANVDLERQVRERTAELEKARNIAMSASKIKSEFIANISHEIRTPIHGVFGMLRLLRQDPLTERQEHRLLMAETSINELTDLINGILDISKIEAEKLEIEATEVHLPTIIHNSAYLFAIPASDKKIELIVDCANVSDTHVMGDPGRIGQIFSNLISNAIKYTDAGQVLISAKTTLKGDSELMLSCSVSDTGVGISPQAQAQLFQPFSRGDQAEESKAKGTGLGLAIASQLCKLMDGEILVTSKKGEGTEFSFYLRLPLCEHSEDSSSISTVIDQGSSAIIVDTNQSSANAAAAWLTKSGAKTHLYPSFEDIDVPTAQSADILLIDTDSYMKHRKRIIEIQSGRTNEKPMRVLVSAPLSLDATNLQETFKKGTALLEKPITGISLEDSLLSAYGVERKPVRDLTDITDTEKQRIWNALATLKVLVVDDNAINQKVVGGMLEEYGVQVAYARTGEDAINVLKKNTDQLFDLVLMDCQMPVMDGYEATRRIRAGNAGFNYIRIPIIAVTAGAMAGDRMKCLESGMTDYLTKPVQPYELERKILTLGLDKIGNSGEVGDGPSLPASVVVSGLNSEVQKELSKLSVWDKDAVLKRLMNRIEILDTVIEMYKKSAPEIIDNLKEAISTENFNQIRILAHDLKGISENVGGKKVGYLCYELELAAMDKHTDTVKYLSDILMLQFGYLVEALRDEESTSA